ncbi:tax1-binding protein 3 homolog [Oppia nitens]|uniref:tax1-binding protein 3 homolog n=1 Tax=Oppia nitens TaxID=1686743 RepID=UPI0023DA7F09|nr:tax1-binding protein 3 homolog [Oppia nitens]
MSTFEHKAGTAIECLSIPIKLTKEISYDETGRELLKCGFKIGGGIDQDFRQSPHGFTDNGIYVTDVTSEGPAWKCGLRMGDKILQCNGYDFTMVTHRKAVEYIKKHPILNMLIARKGVTQT